MRWTLGLLLLAAAGCGANQTKMVACPETGCPESFAKVSPEGTRYTPKEKPVPMESTLPPTPPDAPLPDTTPPPPDVPVPSP
jgi:hypothetical protein